VVPEYLYPGVYVEEVSFRGKPIEGVSTSTAGFVGPARFGPIGMKPCVITNLQEFERIYGDGGQLVFADSGQMHNYLWHAVRAFFAEGGRRLHIARAFLPRGNDDDGVASCNVPADGGTAALGIRALFPGAAGNFLVRFTVRLGANILSGAAGQAIVDGLQENDTVWIGRASSDAPTVLGIGATSLAALDSAHGEQLRVVDVAVSVLLNDGSTRVWDHVPPDPARLLAVIGTGQTALPLTIMPGDGVTDGLDVLNALFTAKPSLRAALDDPHSTESDRSVDVLLSGGNDGARPTSDVFRGNQDLPASTKTGLQAFEDVEEISIVGAPGATFGYRDGYKEEADRIVDHLIAHAERMRYRIAVLDSGDGLDITEVRGMRARLDSRSAALYYPWVRTRDPITGQDIDLPPSGFVAGVYARNDIEKGVSKAPANQVVNLGIGLETLLTDTQQEALNLEGINSLRTFVGRGVLVWGARTISSDPEWKYVGIRRYFAYLEHSIDRGTQWTVFEPNGEVLWAKVQRNIEDFLLNEWRSGALMGDKPERAFFVRCDRSTMTQIDLDNGQLVCLIGVAQVRPAEFVILRIGQWTADRRC
jgi:phage tail sheath protein FI